MANEVVNNFQFPPVPTDTPKELQDYLLEVQKVLESMFSGVNNAPGGINVGGVIDMNSEKVISVAAPTNGGDAANKTYVDTVAGSKWEVDGSETQLITADEIDMQSKKIINVTTPTDGGDATNKTYVDTEVAAVVESKWVVDGSETQLITADEIDMQSKKIINVTDPGGNQDAATKKYVDDNISGGGFVDRGDPAEPDYVVGDLTTDGTWKTLDLNTDVGVPTGATAVALAVTIQDGAVGSEVRFRTNGNSNDDNQAHFRTIVANVFSDVDCIVPPASGVIDFMGSNLTFTTINITVKGWWL